MDPDSTEAALQLKHYIPLVGVFLASLAFPTIREWHKTSRTAKSLVRMIGEDIRERTERTDRFIPALHQTILKCQADANYVPLVFNTKGLTNHIDWKADKWLLPPHLSGDILGFYNTEIALGELIDYVFSETFQNEDLSRERKILAIERILSDMKDVSSKGNTLLSIMRANRLI